MSAAGGVTVVNVVEKLLYRKPEAAFALGCSLRAIDYMIADRRLSARKFGRNTVIPAADVRRVAQEILRSDMHEGVARARG
jgi:hypothetical protein